MKITKEKWKRGCSPDVWFERGVRCDRELSLVVLPGGAGEGEEILHSVSHEQSFQSITFNLRNPFMEEQVVQPGCAVRENIEQYERQTEDLNSGLKCLYLILIIICRMSKKYNCFLIFVLWQIRIA